MYLMMCFLIMTFLAIPVLAEEEVPPQEGWIFSGNASLAGNWTYYSNWQEGGTDSSSVSGQIDFSGLFKMDRHEWKNTLKIEYGMAKLNGIGTRKTTDSTMFESRYDFKFSGRMSVYGRVAASTELDDGYLYYEDPVDAVFDTNRPAEMQTDEVHVSGGFEPLKFDEGVGLGYTLYEDTEKKNLLKVNFGAGARQLIVSNYYIEDDDDDTDTLEFSLVDEYSDVGAETGYDGLFNFRNNITFTSKGKVFYGVIDGLWNITWSNKLVISLTKYFGVSLSSDMIYDESVIAEYQWKNVTLLTLGFKLF